MRNAIISIISLIFIFVSNAPAYSYSSPATFSENNLVNINLLSLDFRMDNQNGLVFEKNKEKNLILNSGIELSVGIGSGLAGALLFGFIGLMIGNISSENSSHNSAYPHTGMNLLPPMLMLLGVFGGYTAGSSIGVYASGQMLGDNGNFWLTLLVGFLSSILSIILGGNFHLYTDKFSIFIVLYSLLTAGGSVLSYNLTTMTTTDSEKKSEDTQLYPL